jgi:L-iditol 2-dehydrogenase
MRMAELVDRKLFRLTEGAIPDPGPGEVQVAVRAVGICGSDLHAYGEGAVGDMTCAYPMVLGHEPAGEVVQLGPGVTGWSRGDAAALEPAHYCYHCELCRRGRHNICEQLRFLSTPGQPGFFRERVNLPAENLVRLPANVALAVGTLVEPLAVVLHAIKLAPPVLGETAAVIGAGPIGLLTVAALKRAGVGRVWAVEPLPHRRELARLMGADATLAPEAPESLAAAVVADSGGRGVDLVFDCAAKGGSEEASLRMAAPGGRVVFTGISSEARVPLDVHLWRRKELGVHQVRRSNHDGPAARDLLAREPRAFAPLVTHQRPLEAIDEGFRIASNYEDGVGKLVLTIAA